MGSGRRERRATTSRWTAGSASPCFASRSTTAMTSRTCRWRTSSRPPATTSARSRSPPASAPTSCQRGSPPSTTTTGRSWSRPSPTAWPRRSRSTCTRSCDEAGPKQSNEELIAERYRGIRPAFGYPACPDHSEKRTLFDLLDARSIGMELTESGAMTPTAAVAGLYFAHPQARYFMVGKVGRDQVQDYARRKGMTVAEAERWLRPNLAYD